MTPEEVAWMAGVIDARGHIGLNNRHGRPQPRIRVTTARLELLHVLAKRTGVGVRADDRAYQKRPCSEHCTVHHQHVVRQSAYWNVDSARATIVLYNIVPYMLAQRDRALGALNAGRAMWPPRGSAIAQMKALGWATPQGTGTDEWTPSRSTRPN